MDNLRWTAEVMVEGEVKSFECETADEVNSIRKSFENSVDARFLGARLKVHFEKVKGQMAWYCLEEGDFILKTGSDYKVLSTGVCFSSLDEAEQEVCWRQTRSVLNCLGYGQIDEYISEI
jgi:hypothetical protein